MKGLKVLAVNDPAINSYKNDSYTYITKDWENNNSCEVHIDIVDWDNYKKAVDNALIKNEGNYDIVMAPSFWIPNFASNNLIVPFEEYVNDKYDISDIFPSIIDEISYGNKLIGIPSFTDGHILFYRKDKVNLDKVVTIENLKEALNNLKEDRKFALKASRYEIFLDFLPFLWSNNGQIFGKNNNIELNSPNAIKALDTYIGFKKYCPQDVANYGNDEIKNALQNDKVYIGVSWSGQSAAIMNENKFADKIAFATYEYPCNTTWTFLVNKHSSKIRESFSYLMHCTNKENDLKSGRISGSPVRISTYQNKEELKTNPWYEINFIMLKNAKRVPPCEEWTEISDMLYKSVYDAFTGTLSLKEALDECCNKIKNNKN